jgi:excinuclease UvrABC nuclease subunit
MLVLAEQLEFEQAAKVRDKIAAIEKGAQDAPEEPARANKGAGRTAARSSKRPRRR